MPRKILHLDLDAFFCAVEEKHDPSLQGKAFVVGGRPDSRGVVTSASYPARAFGIRSAMPTGQALRLCPQLIIVSGRHYSYQSVSGEVMERLATFTPLVEQISIDEAFLDVSDLPQPGLEIARQIQQTIRAELALPSTIGVAANKLVAKMATDAGKAAHRGKSGPPYAIVVVPPGQEAAFLAPLPIEALWGVGPKTAARLAQLGVHIISDLTRLPESQLVHYFGKMGIELAERARGLDERPVVTGHDAKSISSENTYIQDVHDRDALLATLRQLTARVCYRLRRENLCGSTIHIKLRWSDFTTLTRQVTLRQPTAQDGVVFETAQALFEQNWFPGRPVRLLGVGVSGLSSSAHQLSLWDTRVEKEQRLLEALDSLRERYGGQVVFRASELEEKD